MPEKDEPQGIVPYMTLESGSAKKAAEFYEKVLGAAPTFTRPADEGDGIAHMTMALNGGTLMLSDQPEWGGWTDHPRSESNTVGWLALHVEDCDRVYAEAIAAGAESEMAPEDTPWGDRYARFRDPFGQLWAISSPRAAGS